MQCKARSKRSGQRCLKHASPGREVCHIHGGGSLRGADHPRFKTGRYSKFLPDRLAERYHRALADPGILRLDDEIALVDAQLQVRLEGLPTAGMSKATAAAVRDLIEQRRKLVDTERRRLMDEERVVTVERLMLLMTAIIDIIRRHVPSPEVRAKISDELRLLAGGSGTDPEPE